ncbi:MAG: hypothetical protein F2587_00365 [Actinobacteria bacterium]|uniref:Unannotated protein n=1 Tax=freshwater metagenome TaxID=449393 RepID=A0A6J6GK34_9ZZZZ|nr:hypothetical protein [Rhodoluna sp.]MSZ94665.1 hypothetical protein [Actinomycetota bacterium]
MKKTILIGVAIASLLAPGVSYANTINGQTADLYERMNELGVEDTYQDSLVNLILSGGVPLSNNPDAEPSSSTSKLVSGWKEVRSVYADGSVQITKIQQPQLVQNRALITGCKVQSGTGYKNYSGCMVDNNTVTTYFGFRANYGYVVGGRDAIFSVYDPFVFCYFGSCSEPVLAITKKYEDSNGPAVAKLSTVFTLFGGVASSTTSISLQVGNDSAKVVVK